MLCPNALRGAILLKFCGRITHLATHFVRKFSFFFGSFCHNPKLFMTTTMAKVFTVYSVLFVGAATVLAQQAPPPVPAAAPVLAPAAPGISFLGPRIRFETPVYDFGKVKSGELVKHTYVFTNTGDEALVLTNVQPSCGCTTAGEWSKQVDPGKTGTIPIQFNSAHYSGQVLKTITVTSNDKEQHSFGLQLKGTIWKPIDVNPSFAVMNIPPDADSNITQKVQIVNNMEEEVTLSPPVSNNSAFQTELRTNTPGKNYEVVITMSPPFDKPNMQAQISLKSSSTNMPEVTFTVLANMQQAVVVNPAQVMLAAAPLATKQTISIMVQNNSAKPLKLTEPAVDAKGVEVRLSEPNPGRYFTIQLDFPQGFEIAQGAKAEFTVKSDHPRYPVIKVPITQAPKTAAVPTPPHPEIIPITPPATVPASAAVSKP